MQRTLGVGGAHVVGASANNVVKPRETTAALLLLLLLLLFLLLLPLCVKAREVAARHAALTKQSQLRAWEASQPEAAATG